jgi:hypothetical protein
LGFSIFYIVVLQPIYCCRIVVFTTVCCRFYVLVTRSCGSSNSQNIIFTSTTSAADILLFCNLKIVSTATLYYGVSTTAMTLSCLQPHNLRFVILEPSHNFGVVRFFLSAALYLVVFSQPRNLKVVASLHTTLVVHKCLQSCNFLLIPEEWFWVPSMPQLSCDLTSEGCGSSQPCNFHFMPQIFFHLCGPL